VCFEYKSNIDFAHVQKGLEFQLVIGKPIGVPEDYKQRGLALVSEFLYDSTEHV
jgi:hypothetical protein